jgi:hypothetical protein
MIRITGFFVFSMLLCGLFTAYAFAEGYSHPFGGGARKSQSFENELTMKGVYYGYHSGEDWVIDNNQVLSVADGSIVICRSAGTGLGWYIVIRHDGFYSAYTHVVPKQGIQVGVGVTAGRIIAEIDYNTIYSAHLHWEIKPSWDEKTRWWAGCNDKGYYNSLATLRAQSFVNPSEFMASKIAGYNPPTPAQEKNPQIIYAYPKQSSVRSGEDVWIYAKTNDAVEKVALINERGETAAGSGVPTTNRNGEKEWDFAWKTQDVGTRSVKVRAYAGGKTTDYAISLTVTGEQQAAAPSAPSVSGNTVLLRAGSGQSVSKGYGAYANAAQIGLPNDSIDYINVGTGMKVAAYANDNYDGQRWIYEAGEHKLDGSQRNTISSLVVLNKNDGNDTIPGRENIVSNPPAETEKPLRISSVSKDKSSYKVGDFARITVKATGAPTQAFVRTETGEEFALSTSHTTSGDTRTFTLNWELGKAGNREVWAGVRNAAGRTEYYKFAVSVAEAAKPTVAGVSVSNGNPTAGDTITVTVHTNAETTRVCLVNERQEKVAETTSGYTTSGNQRVWTLKWGIVDPGNRQIAVYAGDNSDYQWDRQYMEWFYVTVNAKPAESMKIFSVAVANYDVKVGDYCWMTAVTSPDITNVWIVNESNGDTVYQLVRSYAVGANKGWDIGWQLGRSGYRTGYVVATNGTATTKMAFNCNAYD